MADVPAWRAVTSVLPMPAERAWELLTDPSVWPSWGPTVRAATLEGPFVSGTAGTVTTVVGLTLPFTLREVVPGSSWTWDVAGVRATTHRVAPAGPAHSRVSFGVPAWALAYLPVCRVALARLARWA